MKRIITLVLPALMLAVFVGCGQRYETVRGDALETKIHTLDNGLKVFMSVNDETPRIQTFITVKVGSKNDPSETTGLAHYFEHLMFKGTENFGTSDYAAEKPMLDEIEQLFEVYRATEDEAGRKAIYAKIDSISYEASKIAIPNEYDKLMASIGAEGTNAWTSADETTYMEDIPSNQIDNWAKIQADRFRNGVIRGFHTELETIYEEKNMSLTDDSRKVWEAIDQALFPNHPYGQQTTLGTQEHLKNPSITNVKNYRDTYYVPNNIAICVSGSFNPDEMVAAIEKYFGDWEPNPDIPVLEYESEAPITEPVVKEVYGLESESLALAWRLPGSTDLETAAVAEIAEYILSNGSVGLIDLNVNQAQEALYLQAGYSSQPDYSSFLAVGAPKEGQTLEQLRDLALGQIALLRNGEFDESIIKSTINNLKLNKLKGLESNWSRAYEYVTAFISGTEWKDACKKIERLENVTKEDVVDFANKYLTENSYAVVYKRQGEDKNQQKISAPEITPIVANRDNQSAFLQEIASSTVKPIEPVFVDFSKDMSVASIAEGVELLYKKNELNDIFTLNLRFTNGYHNDPELTYASDYLSYLGTADMSYEEFSMKMYELACEYSLNIGGTYSWLRITGLSENMAEAVKLVENLIMNAEGDEEILENIKSDVLTNREREKSSQDYCYSALQTYAIYGPEYIKKTTLSNDAVMALDSEALLSKIRTLFSLGHKILYYGPMAEPELKDVLAKSHTISENPEVLPENAPHELQTPSSSVIMAQYDAKQIYYMQYSNRGEKFDINAAAPIALYNEYFGGGMNSIVFQEMREARGLAYSSWASLASPTRLDDDYYYCAFIATQNDKMRQAIEAFDDIINNMPQSEAAFSVAKEALLGRLRTQRVTGYNVLTSYLDCQFLGLTEPETRVIFENVQNMTLEDIAATQQKWVKDRPYTYMILGDIKDLDTKFLKTLGPVKTVTLEEIFGY